MKDKYWPFFAVYLDCCKNPPPKGVVMWDWLGRSRMGLAEGPLTAIPILELCRNVEKGGSSEQISEVITHDKALPVSHSLGSEVSVLSGFTGCCGPGSGRWD
jgi:hypothetical protein